MNWRTTWMLLSLAGLLMAFILLVERHSLPTSETAQPPGRLLDFKPAEVTGVQLRREDELFARVDQSNALWQMTFPLNYPAQGVAVEALLEDLSQLQNSTFLTPEEIRQRRQTTADFHLDTPLATLVLQHAGGRLEIRFGDKTPVGDRVYAQIPESKNIYVVSGAAFDRLPRSPSDWRDSILTDLRRVAWDRLEMRSPTRAFCIQVDPTNRTFVLTKPTPARADGPKIISLLNAIQNGRVIEFVEDNPRADWEPYGLATPRGELVFGHGTNDVFTLRFGDSPTNRADVLYAVNSAHTNVVLVPRSFFESVHLSHAELREKRLLTFLPEQVHEIEIISRTNVVLRRQTGGGWEVIRAQPFRADDELVLSLFDRLGRLEGEVERDVVSDLTIYGLDPPVAQYRLSTIQTNAAGVPTNRLVGRIDFGTMQEEKVFVRRANEASVFSLPRTDFDLLPREAWQLRDRQVWSFTTNDVVRVLVRMRGREVEMVRSGPARWELAPGSQGILNDLALEETVFRLGNLRADYWIARGEDQRVRYGFNDPHLRITIELKAAGGKPQSRVLEFSQAAPNQFPYALTDLDGQPVIFEFPKKLYFEVVRDLLNPFWKDAALP